MMQCYHYKISRKKNELWNMWFFNDSSKYVVFERFAEIRGSSTDRWNTSFFNVLPKYVVLPLSRRYVHSKLLICLWEPLADRYVLAGGSTKERVRVINLVPLLADTWRPATSSVHIRLKESIASMTFQESNLQGMPCLWYVNIIIVFIFIQWKYKNIVFLF